MKKTKIWLVLAWWWTRSSYSVGVARALHELWFQPYLIIAGSWSAATWAYYISQQIEDLTSLRQEEISRSHIVNPRRIRKITDVDSIVDDVLKKRYPLLLEKVFASEIIYKIPVTNIITWRVEYLTPSPSIDLFECIRATMAIPFGYPKNIHVCWKEYKDWSNSSGYELHIKKAQSLWAEKVICVHNDVGSSAQLTKIYLKMKSKEFKRNYANEYEKRMKLRKKLLKNDKENILLLGPQKPLDFWCFWILNNSKQTMSDAMKQGYQETIENKRLINFLS